MRSVEGRLREWFGGTGLTAGFFLPIAAAREIDDAMLMWTWRHSAELFASWAVLALIVTTALVRTLRVQRTRRQATLLLMLGLLPALSLIAVTGHTIRDIYGTSAMPTWAPVAGTLALALLVTCALWFAPGLVTRALRGMYACTAVLMVPLFSFGLTGARDVLGSAPRAASTSAGNCGHVYVLLFDELSYDAAFAGGRSGRPAMARLASSATVYHGAQAPAPLASHSSPNTLDAIPQYLNAPTSARPSDSVARGPFGLAQRAGYQTEVVGWYYPYCAVLGSLVDRCHEYSLYNVATMFGHFAPWAPTGTVFNIWPYQFPTGLLKRPVAVRVHAGALDAIVSRAIEPPRYERVFRWVHFNIPHMPWLRGNGFLSRSAFEPSMHRYEQQVVETDRVLGKVLDAFSARGDLETSTIVLTSDHGLREEFGGRESLHVPLVVRTPGGTGEDRHEPVQVADVLRTVASASCPAG
jgi:hypothetical protein